MDDYDFQPSSKKSRYDPKLEDEYPWIRQNSEKLDVVDCLWCKSTFNIGLNTRKSVKGAINQHLNQKRHQEEEQAHRVDTPRYINPPNATRSHRIDTPRYVNPPNAIRSNQPKTVPSNQPKKLLPTNTMQKTSKPMPQTTTEKAILTPIVAITADAESKARKLFALEAVHVYDKIKRKTTTGKSSNDVNSNLWIQSTQNKALSEAISIGALGPRSVQNFLTELGQTTYYSVEIIEPVNNVQPFLPIGIRYFHREKGLQLKCLDLLDTTDSSADIVSNLLINTLNKSALPFKYISGFSADQNGNANGDNDSVFNLVSQQNPKIKKVISLANIVQETANELISSLNGDFEAFIYAIYDHFVTLEQTVQNLEEIQVDAVTVITFINRKKQFLTRWLTLKPAVDQILQFWEPLQAYFVKIDQVVTTGCIQLGLFDQAERTRMGLMYLSHMLLFLETAISNLQKYSATVIDGHVAMEMLKQRLETQLETSFYGTTISDALTLLNENDQQQHLDEFNRCTEDALFYLMSAYNFKPNSLEIRMASLDLTVGPQGKPQMAPWKLFESLAKELPIVDISLNHLLMDIEFVQQYFVANEKFWKLPIVDRWRKIFELPGCNLDHLYRLMSYILSLPVSLSHPIGVLLTNNSNINDDKSLWDLIRNETLIAENIDTDTDNVNFFLKVNNDSQLLDEIQIIWNEQMSLKEKNGNNGLQVEYIDERVKMESNV